MRGMGQERHSASGNSLSSPPAKRGNFLLGPGEISAEWKYKSGRRKLTRNGRETWVGNLSSGVRKWASGFKEILYKIHLLPASEGKDIIRLNKGLKSQSKPWKCLIYIAPPPSGRPQSGTSVGSGQWAQRKRKK